MSSRFEQSAKAFANFAGTKELKQWTQSAFSAEAPKEHAEAILALLLLKKAQELFSKRDTVLCRDLIALLQRMESVQEFEVELYWWNRWMQFFISMGQDEWNQLWNDIHDAVRQIEQQENTVFCRCLSDFSDRIKMQFHTNPK